MIASDMIEVPYVFSGFSVGFIVGMTGVGGGSLMTPLLVLLFGIHPATAVGTDLLYAATTKSCGTAVHHIGNTVEWRVMGLLAAGSLPASLLTLFVLHQFDVSSNALGELISHILGYALLLTVLSLIFRRYILVLARRLSVYRNPRLQATATILLGAYSAPLCRYPRSAPAR